MPYRRKQFVGGAPATSLAAGLTDVATTFDVDDATGYPDATNPFVLVIDPGLATEEKVLVAARTGVTCSSITRGYDDTTAQAHSSGAVVQHVLDAGTIDQVNRLANLLDAKGELLGFDGTNPVAIAADQTDDYALVVKTSEASGFAIERPVHVVDDASTPSVTGVPRTWFDTNTGQIRTSNGTDWRIPASLPVFANDAARDAYFGGTPTQDGVACVVGTGTSLTPQVWDGSAWTRLASIYEGIPRFADTTARDAFFTSPVTGDMAFANDTHQLTEYREDEWILLNRKFTTDASPPASPHEGDIWLAPS